MPTVLLALSYVREIQWWTEQTDGTVPAIVEEGVEIRIIN